jgi:predicted ATPase
MTENFIRRVRIRNYKSIGDCDVELGRLTILVGRNGSGKSNFLDALRFVFDGLQTSLDHALKSRGGIDEVRRRSTGHPHNFGVELQLNLPDSNVAEYGFVIEGKPRTRVYVKSERLSVVALDEKAVAGFLVENGSVKSETHENLPPAASDRLYLVTASGFPAFRTTYDELLSMGFYNLNPEEMKQTQPADAGNLLIRDGSNLASVIGRLSEDRPDIKDRIQEYLQIIVPEIVDFQCESIGHLETIRFWQKVKGANHPWKFYAASMSDGTMRTLGILVATMQLAGRQAPVRLVGIEEPETALHPAAAQALMDSLREAAQHTQVVVTTHSPDLLDHFDPEFDTLLVVQSNEGTTEIGPADPASMNAVKSHLYTPGDLLRMDQLQPDLNGRASQPLLAFDSAESPS